MRNVYLCILALLLLVALTVPTQPLAAQEPTPTIFCYWTPEGEWVCISGIALTVTPTATPIAPPPIETATPTPTPTPTVEIQPFPVCSIAHCVYLPIGRTS